MQVSTCTSSSNSSTPADTGGMRAKRQCCATAAASTADTTTNASLRTKHTGMGNATVGKSHPRRFERKAQKRPGRLPAPPHASQAYQTIALARAPTPSTLCTSTRPRAVVHQQLRASNWSPTPNSAPHTPAQPLKQQPGNVRLQQRLWKALLHEQRCMQPSTRTSAAAARRQGNVVDQQQAAPGARQGSERASAINRSKRRREQWQRAPATTRV